MAAVRGAGRSDRCPVRCRDRGRARLDRARSRQPPRGLAGVRNRGGEGARARAREPDEGSARCRMGRPRRPDQRGHPDRVAGAPDGRGAPPAPRGPRGATRLPDGRARGALAQARRPPAVLPRRNDRPLRRPRERSRGSARLGRMSGESTLRSVIEESAAALPDVRVAKVGAETSWSRGDRVFAVLDDAAAELRLDIPIAAAAIQTPDTAASTRGREWVRFAPATLDGHAADRLKAWFGLGYR